MPTKAAQLHVNPASHHRFHLLDALRGIAAAFVVNVHLAPSVRLPMHGAFLAVDLFFCLSGFVIAFAYENRLAQGMRATDFMVARWIRLYPLYLLGTIVGLTFLLATNNQHPEFSRAQWASVLLLGLLMLPNFATIIPFPLNPPSWSLFAELFLNAIYAALMRLRMASAITLSALAVFSFAALYRWVQLEGSTLDIGHDRSTILIGLARAGLAFPMGVLAYRLYTKRKSAGATLLSSKATASSVVAIVTVLSIVIFSLHPRIQRYQLLCVVFAIPSLVYFGAQIRLPSKYEKVCTFLGDMSYPLYALHYNFVYHWASFDHLHRLAPRLSQLSFPLLAISLGWISNWLGRHYDLPVRRFLAARYNDTRLRLRALQSRSAEITEPPSV